jgi:hypothetical protein
MLDSQDERLEELLTIAQEQVRFLKREAERDPAAGSRRREAARLRVAEDQVQRVGQAIAELPEIRERKKSNNHTTTTPYLTCLS